MITETMDRRSAGQGVEVGVDEKQPKGPPAEEVELDEQAVARAVHQVRKRRWLEKHCPFV